MIREAMADELHEGVVTVMFTDVVGSTDLTNRLGDEAARRILEDHKAVVRECVAEHGGREIDSIGDGFMMAFGSPRRAVSCAVAIQRSLREHRRQDRYEEVRVRIGLNVGEVLERDGHPFGAAINAARRVVDYAKGSEILVAEPVKQLVGTIPGVSFRDRGRFRLKGFDERWRLYEVEWADGKPATRPVPKPRAQARPRPRSPLIAAALLAVVAAVVGFVALVRGNGSSALTRIDVD
jgi:class 3 adenylate cyclase